MPTVPASPQSDQRRLHLEHCTECGACVRACAFLTRYGLPTNLAAMDVASAGPTAFECSLCGLCQAVCPVDLNPGALCMQQRREAVSAGVVQHGRYRSLLFFEWLGLSRWTNWRVVPPGCETVFFPGCTLPGLQPGLVEAIYAMVAERIPKCGLVLDCCGKSSHDLGRHGRFEDALHELLLFFREAGITRVLVACPNCLRIFSQYGEGLEVTTVYEVLAAGQGMPQGASAQGSGGSAPFVVHDPCAARFQTPVQDAVRTLVHQAGLEVDLGKNEKAKTFCCGEGGAVCFTEKPLCTTWLQKRLQSLGEGEVLTYCGGCVSRLHKVRPTKHVLEYVTAHATGQAGPTATPPGKPGSLRHAWRRFRLRKRAQGMGHGSQRPDRPAWSLRRWLAPR